MIHYPITGLANYSFKSQNKCYHRKKNCLKISVILKIQDKT